MGRRYALGRYLGGAAAVRAGDEMAGPALLLAGLAVTGSSSSAAVVLAGVTASAAIGGPFLGVLLDRSARPGRVLCGALALYGLGLGATLGALGRLPLAATVAVAMVTGLFGPAVSAGWSSQLTHATSGERLRWAHAWDAMTFDLASLVGPALTAAVTALLGAPAAVVAAAALVCAALPVAWRMPRRGAVPQRDRARAVFVGPVEGARAIVRSRPLARATLTSVVACVAQGMLVAGSTQLGRQVFGGPAAGVLLLSGVAGAALVANAVAARHPRAVAPDPVVRYSALLQAAALLLAATGRPALVVAGILVMGVAEGLQLTALFAVRHREAPERLRAQVFTLGASLKITAFAAGAALAGPIAARSAGGVLVVAAGFALLASLAYGCVRRR